MEDIKKLMSKWLNKKGIPSYYTMTPEEKEYYNSLEQTLKGKELTSEDVKEFWKTTINDITDRLVEEDLTDKQRDFLLVELRLVKKIVSFLSSSETKSRNARMMVEQQLID